MKRAGAVLASGALLTAITGLVAPATAYAASGDPAPSCVSQQVSSNEKVVYVYNNCYGQTLQVKVRWRHWQDSYCKILKYGEGNEFRTGFGSFDGVIIC